MAKGNTYTKNDNTAFTVGELYDILLGVKLTKPNVWSKISKKPVKMSVDEEGNGYGKLFSVDISISNGILLWPADTELA
jgi:hypothetical protein